MRFIPLIAALALAFATPALAQQSATPSPGDAAKSRATDKAKSENAQKAKAAKDKAAKDKADKAKAQANERSNKGGATRGQDRADQVREMNSQRRAN